MNRFDIINRIGDKYRVGNTETGEFSYAQALKTVGKDIKDYQKATTGTQHKFLDIRFENERLVVLVECKNKFSRWDKAKIQGQLQDYVRFEKAYSDKKIVAILAETDGDEVWVWFGQSVIIDDEHRILICSMGNGIDAVITTSDEPKYNYVSRDSNGNGVVGFVDEIEGEEPFPAGAMSLALGGSFLGSCFIQKKPFYTAQNVAVLQEKVPLSDHTKLFIATLIRNECKIKYQAFGRELNAHFRKDFTIKLPVKRNADGIVFDETHEFSDDGYIPDWEWMDSYMRSLPYSDRL